MQIYDLDVNEKPDVVIVGGVKYEIWDIPPSIYAKIQKISTKITTDEYFMNKWKDIIEELLKIRNKDVNIKYNNTTHILKIIEIITHKIRNQDDYKQEKI